MAAPYDYSQYHPGGNPTAADPYQAPPHQVPYGQAPPPGAYPPNAYAPAAGYGPPQPYGGYPPSAFGPQPTFGGGDEVRTIFITGFPSDVKERELNNLLRFLPGYEASQMNWKNDQAQGFALFATGALARSACDAITQLCFDEASVLRCEMARKNMYIKDDPAIKRPRTSAYSSGPAIGAMGGNGPMAGGMPPSYSSRPPSMHGAGAGRSSGPVSSAEDNPPCNTLYIGNLGDAVSEAELKAVFGASPAFKFLKVVHGPRSTNCFVEYEDVASATTMHSNHQGVTLQSSDRGPLRVQFSKNPYGKKRDRDSGLLIDTLPRDYPAPGTAPA